MENRLKREQKTVEVMIKLYCKINHNVESIPCKECSLLIDYALQRVQFCRFGVNKPVCGRCDIHCYKRDMREQIRKVMRTIGYKLIYKHPIMFLYHVIDMVTGTVKNDI